MTGCPLTLRAAVWLGLLVVRAVSWKGQAGVELSVSTARKEE